MIISHRYKFIFIAIFKTGTTSIEEALKRKITFKSKDYDILKDDINPPHRYKSMFITTSKIGTVRIEDYLKQRILLKSKNYDTMKDDINSPLQVRNQKIRKHMPAQELKEVLGENKFNSYFKFCFVRNPWDITLSSYLFAKDHRMILQFFKDGTKDPWYSRVVKAKELSFRDYLFYFKDSWKNYLSYISDKEGNLLMDFVGKFENIQKDFNEICRIIGINKIRLPHLNKSNRRDYAKCYDKESKKLISNIYKREIKLFGYKFE